MYANAHFRPEDSPAWKAEHFLGEPRAETSRVPTKADILKWRDYKATRPRAPLPEWAKVGNG